jgi:hypothetical protein
MEISIFSNNSHLEWRAELLDTILKGTHLGTIPARLGLIWFSSFRGEDLNVKVYDVTMIIEEGAQKDNYFAVNVGSCKRFLSYFKTLIQSILKHWREAATLIIAARSNNITNKFNYDILMMKRSGKSRFMPSLYVFEI